MMNTASSSSSSSATPGVAKEYNYNYQDSNNDDDDDDVMLSMTLLSSNTNQRDVEVEVEEDTNSYTSSSLKRKCCKCFQHKTTTFLFGVVVATIFVVAAMVVLVKNNGNVEHHQRRQLLIEQPQRRQLSTSIISNHRGDTSDKKDEPPSPADLKIERLTTHWHIQSQERQHQLSKERGSNKEWNPFFGTSGGNQVNVIQIGDQHYQSWYERQSLLNQKWSQCAGYKYKLMDWETPTFQEGDDMGSHNCAYTTKVKMIRDYFTQHTRVGDWLIFADLDAYYQYEDCTMLEQVLAREVKKLQQAQQDQQRASASSHQRNRRENEVLIETSHKCEVIIHATSAVGINSGVLILKHTPAVRQLLETWYKHQYNTGFCRGAGDQWTLQELMLELNRESMQTLSSNFSRDECVSKGYGPFTNSPRGPCSASKLYNERQHARMSSTSSLVPMGSNMCFFQCTAEIPLQCHDCERDQDASQQVLLNHKATTPTLTKSICLNKPPLFHHSRGMLEHFEADA